MNDLSPARWFGTPAGSDGTIIKCDAIRQWLQEMSSATRRMHMQTFGTSTEGNPLDVLYIGAEPTIDRLASITRERRTAAARLLSGTDPTARWPTPIVLITSGIHATEIGGPQSIPEMAHWLVTSDAPEAVAIRERVLTIIVPTLNPDGMDMVSRWHVNTSGTDRAGTLPPLLYHRFAGHDNNRDWLFRNLRETRAVVDEIHDVWLPHVTLDQHQMNQHGPRFVLPPYADPWEPNVHPAIIAATNALGQAVAADLTLSGLAGVTTSRYFDAWEPSRAIQHYRGGVRILAEAASANLAHPIEITPDQLRNAPLPQRLKPSASCPMPWAGGVWRLRDIMDYHVAAAKSLLGNVARAPERWVSLQDQVLMRDPTRSLAYQIPFDRSAIDVAANRRLADILLGAGANRGNTDGSQIATFNRSQPVGPLLSALLIPMRYPIEAGPSPYDVTTHHLPLFLGATLQVSTESNRHEIRPGDAARNRYLIVDSRCHMAPNLIELSRTTSLSQSTWRVTKPELFEGNVIQPGTWIVDRQSLPDGTDVDGISTGSIDSLPRSATPIRRRDLVLIDNGGMQQPDAGWTRWWLQARSFPFLEGDLSLIGQIGEIAETTTILVPDTERAALQTRQVDAIRDLLAAGANVIAFGAAGRTLATAISPSVTATEFPAGGGVQAPGALVRLRLEPTHQIGLGLDRVIPAMFLRDGAFSVTDQARCTTVLARFDARDTLVSGWMSDPSVLRNAPAIVRIAYGRGTLHAFAFRPLFRGQTLVTSPLVHNLLYSTMESSSCLPSDLEKMHAGSTSARTS